MHRALLSSLAPSLRGRLLVLILAVFLPGAILTVWVILQSYHNERRAIEGHLTENVRAYASLMDAELNERVAILQGLASASPLESGDLRRFRERAVRVLHNREEWIELADDNYQQLVNTGLAEDVVLPTMERRAELEKAIAADRVYISNLVRSPASGRLMLHITISVRIAGAPGMLSLAMTPDTFGRSLVANRLSRQWVVAVIDREKTLIMRNRDPATFVGRKATPDMQAATARAGEGMLNSVTLEGLDSLATFNTSLQSGWTAIVAAPTATLFAPAKRLLFISLGVAAGVSLLGVGVALLVSRTTVSAVGLLVSETQKLAKGARVEPRRTGIQEADVVSDALAETSRELAARQAALAHARDEAMAASRAKDEFLASLSHELRTPLNPVLLLASEAARDPTYPAPIRETFEMIEKNVLYEARLIDDLLDVTRIAAGKLTLQQKPMRLDATLSDALDTLRPRLLEKRLKLHLSLGAGEALVRGDSTRLQQVFANVIGNAMKFTPDGGSLAVVSRVDAHREIVVDIRDDGIGMTPEEIARIFERFTQGDHARNGYHSRYGGLGLGLSISRSLVELHGGKISAKSAGVGLGSTFSVRLPLLVPSST